MYTFTEIEELEYCMRIYLTSSDCKIVRKERKKKFGVHCKGQVLVGPHEL